MIDINMKDGNMKDWHGEGSIGIIAAKATVEGPIIKDKTSVLVSARRTYLDALTRPLYAAVPGDITAGYYFYDFNTKVNHIINQRNRIYLSTYFGKDKVYSRYREAYQSADGTGHQTESKADLHWGNIITALRWNHVVGPRLFSNITTTYSKYRFNIGSEYHDNVTGGENQFFKAKYISGIEDFATKLDLDFIPTPNHYLRFGGQAIRHKFSPGVAQSSSTFAGDTTLGAREVYATEFYTYVEDDIKIGNLLKLNIGSHICI